MRQAIIKSARLFWIVSMIYYLLLIGYESYYRDYSHVGRYLANGLIAVVMYQILKGK